MRKYNRQQQNPDKRVVRATLVPSPCFPLNIKEVSDAKIKSFRFSHNHLGDDAHWRYAFSGIGG
jgi:hypothetical protein